MSKKTGNTKERFFMEALKLFAEKGYDAVRLSEIAEAVGVSTPALYKHYPGKQALFDALMERSRRGFAEQMDRLGVDFRTDPRKSVEFIHMPEEEQIRVIQQLFLHTLGDEFPALFRKLMTLEQFRNPELAASCNRRYVDAQFDAFEALMQTAMDAGVYRPGNARAMAIQFASPIIVYTAACDREPEKQAEALRAIEAHIRQFNAAYRIASTF